MLATAHIKIPNYYVLSDYYLYARITGGIYIGNPNIKEYITNKIEHGSFYDVNGNKILGVHDLKISNLKFIKTLFGVSDNLQQIINRYRGLLESKDNFAITIDTIYKKDQPKNHGWRFSKWGEYIGDKGLTGDYLYDQKNIDGILIYYIVPLNKKSQEIFSVNDVISDVKDFDSDFIKFINELGV